MQKKQLANLTELSFANALNHLNTL